MATPRAYALPTGLQTNTADATTFFMNYQAIGGDGTVQVSVSDAYVFDASQSDATNAANFKVRVAAAMAAKGLTVSTANIKLFIGEQ